MDGMFTVSGSSRVTSWSVAVAVAGVLIAAVGCASDADTGSTTDPVSEVGDPTTSVAAADTTEVLATAAPPTLRSFATPSDAGKALFAAWVAGDSTAAVGLGPDTDIFALFALPAGPSAKNRGCDAGEFGSASCFFSNGQGGVNVTLAPGPDGWQISAIAPF